MVVRHGDEALTSPHLISSTPCRFIHFTSDASIIHSWNFQSRVRIRGAVLLSWMTFFTLAVFCVARTSSTVRLQQLTGLYEPVGMKGGTLNSPTTAEVPRQSLQAFLRANAKMSILGHIVPGDTFPKSIEWRRRFWDAEAINPDISERICILEIWGEHQQAKRSNDNASVNSTKRKRKRQGGMHSQTTTPQGTSTFYQIYPPCKAIHPDGSRHVKRVSPVVMGPLGGATGPPAQHI